MEVCLIDGASLTLAGTQADSVFSGIATFGRIPYRECFGRDKHEKFDIAILGAPFDTGTSYRLGAHIFYANSEDLGLDSDPVVSVRVAVV
jgi:hypothetical protein